MTRCFSLVLALLLAASLAASPVWCKEQKKPLKVIAPDLIVESFEFGEFPNGPKEVPASEEKFVPKHTTKGGFIGYRLKLKTTRERVKWCSKTGLCKGKDPAKAKINQGYENFYIEPENGLYYSKRVLAGNYPKGKYWIKGWIEGKALPILYYTVK